jgi:hypothetical protein
MASGIGSIDASVDDGLIIVVCFNNDAATKRMKVQAQQNANAMYSSGSKQNIHALISEDFVYSYIEQPYNSRGLAPAVSSALNGYGSLEKECFPNDENMQVAALKSKLRPIGFVPIGMQIEENSPGAISIAITGKGRHKNAICDMSFGARYKLRPPKPSEVASQNFPNGPFHGDLGNNRATLVAETVEAESMYDTAYDTMCHLNHYYNNRASYLKGMERGRENTDMWGAFCINMGNFATTCGVHFLHAMMKAGFVAPALYYREDDRIISKDTQFPKSIALVARKNGKRTDDILGSIVTSAISEAVKKTLVALKQNIQDKEAFTRDIVKATVPVVFAGLPSILREIDPSSSADDYVRKLSTSMGLVNGFNAPEVAGIGAVSDEMKKRQIDFLNSVFLTGDVANYEFGVSKDGSNSAKDSGGRINSTIDGMILKNQYNCFRKAISSLGDAYNADTNWHGGYVTVPCEKGGTWEGLHGQ